ncbi:MAG: histidine kinase [Reichenbachiella sp.]
MIKHPILDGSGYKFYSAVWVIIIVVHTLVMHYYFEFAVEVALLDGMVYNLIFGAMATGFWYIVNFANFKKDDTSLIVTHIGAAFISTLTWAAIAGFLLKLIFGENGTYQNFVGTTHIWRIIIGVIYYCIIVLIFYLIKYYHDTQERVHREMELQHLLKDSELRMLKSQINPHFIFNSLNSINALTLSKPEQAREMVIKLSDFLRHSLGKESIEMNTLAQEIQNISLYLEIEKVRFGDKLVFEKQVSNECLTVEVPNLILQPLIENAIKYGVYESLEPVTIQLNCTASEDYLEIAITNNCDLESIANKGEGIGLENVRKRLSLVYGHHGLMKIKKENNLFSVIINLPLNP